MSKCKYRSKCEHYRTVSHTCNSEPSEYCGKFREFATNGVISRIED